MSIYDLINHDKIGKSYEEITSQYALCHMSYVIEKVF